VPSDPADSGSSITSGSRPMFWLLGETIDQRAELPPRGTLTGWRYGLIGTSGNSTRESPVPGQQQPQAPGHAADRIPFAFFAAMAHYCIMLHLSTTTARSFPFQPAAPSLSWCLVLFLPRGRT